MGSVLFQYVRYEIFMVMNIQIMVFWVVMFCANVVG